MCIQKWPLPADLATLGFPAWIEICLMGASRWWGTGVFCPCSADKRGVLSQAHTMLHTMPAMFGSLHSTYGSNLKVPNPSLMLH